MFNHCSVSYIYCCAEEKETFKINEFSCKLYQRDNKSQLQQDLGTVMFLICLTSLPLLFRSFYDYHTE